MAYARQRGQHRGRRLRHRGRRGPCHGAALRRGGGGARSSWAAGARSPQPQPSAAARRRLRRRVGTRLRRPRATPKPPGTPPPPHLRGVPSPVMPPECRGVPFPTDEEVAAFSASLPPLPPPPPIAMRRGPRRPLTKKVRALRSKKWLRWAKLAHFSGRTRQLQGQLGRIEARNQQLLRTLMALYRLCSRRSSSRGWRTAPPALGHPASKAPPVEGNPVPNWLGRPIGARAPAS